MVVQQSRRAAPACFIWIAEWAGRMVRRWMTVCHLLGQMQAMNRLLEKARRIQTSNRRWPVAARLDRLSVVPDLRHRVSDLAMMR